MFLERPSAEVMIKLVSSQTMKMATISLNTSPSIANVMLTAMRKNRSLHATIISSGNDCKQLAYICVERASTLSHLLRL